MQKNLSELNACSKDDFVAALANIFEYSPWIAEQAAAVRPYSGVKALLSAMRDAVDRAPAEQQMALIKAHPDLANKTQRAAGLTAESTSEQNSLGLDRLSDAEYEAFERVNNAYRAKFGFPYIVCVRRHTKDSVLRDFERRLPNDVATETQTSINEICRIAALRLDQLVLSDDKLPVHGRLSTHVLDTHSGKPAAGISLVLTELSDLGEPRVIARAVTNSDGRTDQPLIGGRPVPIGRYELMFSVGEYFAGRDVPMSEPPFLDQIPVRFSVSDPEGHLHVPLLVTPWSYGTYRGS
ncbi:2-oxo-4-hydroxy-4-carboxy-5-ureidoimidazoline decarboxylase [Bradyrhizobium sp. KBS0727]|uniref:2-oxo-4-hydroxy-4-carboxy-5-ureidoimidazoline decarboxylase n=1 Tax=unclassified Bradyrhizobium TaxID=2631580 RepID=UPI00110EF9B4|nr:MULTISPECIES: 2-oxo-4-hydroxy-4-carboxy-5-ureidoimidazoline decarboxylase [unclassified Bradyrhizobium]QDW40060.1 2-oxo-4-hydroxy-4-carboxy-5-ureidoimidazoline decarboxylase [Bradyrhizobium sp. KBS0725]QDW46663.1 2-oxo-4-hydroxy-4-carboxy-5-ureidoimidazoline decarboxylase [Bradyrhizobium sp. KBS0727]